MTENGLPETIRTSDTRLRRAVLCPAELQADMLNIARFRALAVVLKLYIVVSSELKIRLGGDRSIRLSYGDNHGK